MGGPSSSRGNWGSWLEFLFSVIGCLVGLGNVWRFPYVCYTNGGAAFLIPYLLAMAVCGVPLFFLEMTICQFSNLGPGRVWIVCPLFRGIGFGMVILTSVVSLYYNVIIAWALYYLAMSFRDPLPWTTCGNSWNTRACIPMETEQRVAVDRDPDHHVDKLTSWTLSLSPSPISLDLPSSVADVANMTSLHANMTSAYLHMTSVNVTEGPILKGESSVVQFWTNHVLQDSGRSISDLGDVRWQLFLCLMAAWAVVFFCLFKDIKTSGKVVYVAAVLPYVVLLALLIRGSLLPGAVDGVRFYLLPQWHRLMDWQVWLAAASQVFFSAGIGWGGVSTLASFNRFHNNVYRDALVFPVLDALTSVFAGFVIFVYLGYMAHVQNTSVDNVVTQGTGLAFIAYPDALASMPFPQVWSVLFFLVLFTVGLDSQFAHVQTITSAVVDTWPDLLMHRKRWVTLAVCILGIVLGLPFVTQGGQHVLNLCDWYVAAVSVMLMALGETLVLSWIYGSDRLYDDIALMIGYKPNPVWQVFWKYISPAFVLVTWSSGMVGWKPLPGSPDWSRGLGWVIATTPLLPIPLFALHRLFHSSGTLKERLVASIQPSPEWKPARSKEDGDEESGGQSFRPIEHLLTSVESGPYFRPMESLLTSGESSQSFRPTEPLLTPGESGQSFRRTEPLLTSGESGQSFRPMEPLLTSGKSGQSFRPTEPLLTSGESGQSFRPTESLLTSGESGQSFRPTEPLLTSGESGQAFRPTEPFLTSGESGQAFRPMEPLLTSGESGQSFRPTEPLLTSGVPAGSPFSVDTKM